MSLLLALFGTQWTILTSPKQCAQLHPHPQKNLIYSEKKLVLLFLLAFKIYFLNISITGTVGNQTLNDRTLNDLDADT